MRDCEIGTGAILAAALLVVASCVIVQSLLASGRIPPGSLLVEQAEGEVIWAGARGEVDTGIPAGPRAESGGIVLGLIESPERFAALDHSCIVVLINGREVADFRYGRVGLVVHRGDLIEVQANGSADAGTEEGIIWPQVEVIDTTPNVLAPLSGLRVRLVPGCTVIANASL